MTSRTESAEMPISRSATSATSSLSSPVSRSMLRSSARSGAAEAATRGGHRLGVAAGFEIALAQVDQLALGELLAGAARVLDGHGGARQRRVAHDRHVPREDLTVLERKHVEGAAEFLPPRGGAASRGRAGASRPRAARMPQGRRRPGARRGRERVQARAERRACRGRRRRGSAAACRTRAANRRPAAPAPRGLPLKASEIP